MPLLINPALFLIFYLFIYFFTNIFVFKYILEFKKHIYDTPISIYEHLKLIKDNLQYIYIQIVALKFYVCYAAILIYKECIHKYVDNL